MNDSEESTFGGRYRKASLLRVIRVARFYMKEIWLLFNGLVMSSGTLLSAIFVFVFVNYYQF